MDKLHIFKPRQNSKLHKREALELCKKSIDMQNCRFLLENLCSFPQSELWKSGKLL